MKLKLIMMSIFLFVFGIILFFNTNNKNQIIERALDKQVKILQTHYSISKLNFLNNVKGIKHYIENQEDIINIFSQAKDAKQKQRDILRKKLYTLLTPTYNRIKNMGILQFQFVFPNNTSFLRMHKPSKYGDDLSDIRYSFKYTNETKNDIYGFEQGKTTHGFRYVFPFYDKEKNYLGAVEISLASYELQDKLHVVNKIHTHFLVNKHIMSVKAWEPKEQIQKYITSIENENYLYTLSKHSDKTLLEETRLYVMKNIKNKIVSNMKSNQAFALYTPFKETIKVVSFLPIKDTEKNSNAAYLVSCTENDNIHSVLKDYKYQNILIFLILMFLFYFIYKNIVHKNKLEHNIEEKTKKLKNNLKMTKALLDSSHDGIVVIDENNRCVSINDTGMKMYQIGDESEIVGINILDNVMKESIPTILEHINQQSEATYEIMCLRKDGTTYPAVVKGKTIIQDGKTLRITSVLDITDIKKKEEQLLQKTIELAEHNKLLDLKVEERTNELANSLNIISNHVNYSKTDLEGIITEVSDMFCLSTQYSSDKLIGQSHNITRHPDMQADIFKQMWDTIQFGNKWYGKIKNLKRDGSYYWSETIVSPEYDKNHQIIGYIAIHDNITEQENLKELNTALLDKVEIEQQYNKQKELLLMEQNKLASAGEMIANIAHQWRQPLGIISTLASSIRIHIEYDTLDIENLPNDMDKIVQSTEYLSNIIDIFRNFLSNEKVLKDIMLQNEIKLSIEMVNIALKDSHITMKSDITNIEPLYIHSVSGELIEVIINIINNAKDALLENKINNPWVKIELIKIDNEAIITIEDNGGGIPEEIMYNIFDSYFTTKKHNNGTGIGLHMSKKIITESLKGTLSVKNTENGAKFFIELPLVFNK
ncbi:MAG: PAS domain S-box protein [Campylobacterota bacterium]|nr:PAS domain S-box protein [Campylobacterota bacterium]